MSNYGILPDPQFVMVPFSVLDSPLFDAMDPRAVKLYLKLRRFIWRSEKGPLADYFLAGWLACNGYYSQWAKWLGVSKPTVGRVIAELVAADWLRFLEKSSAGKSPNVLALGRWVSIDGSDERIEIYFLDVNVREDRATVSPQKQTVSPVKQTVSPQKQTVSPVKPSNIEGIDNIEKEYKSFDDFFPPEERAIWHPYPDAKASVLKSHHWSERSSEPWTGWSDGAFKDREGVSAYAQERVAWLVETHLGLRPTASGDFLGWGNGAILAYKAGGGDWDAIEAGVLACAQYEPQYRPGTLKCRLDATTDNAIVKSVRRQVGVRKSEAAVSVAAEPDAAQIERDRIALAQRGK